MIYPCFDANFAKENVHLVWATPEAEQLLVDIARRASNPHQVVRKDPQKLIAYLLKNKHWSPFEMVSLCVCIKAPHDITRQMLRHRSFSFQEFSQRYSEVQEFCLREPRFSHATNRQMSVTCDSNFRSEDYFSACGTLISLTIDHYKDLLESGIAKEVARAILPTGNVLSTIYMTGTLRSWLHYLTIRLDSTTVQREHVWVAEAIKMLISRVAPFTLKEMGLVDVIPD